MKMCPWEAWGESFIGSGGRVMLVRGLCDEYGTRSIRCVFCCIPLALGAEEAASYLDCSCFVGHMSWKLVFRGGDNLQVTAEGQVSLNYLNKPIMY